MNTFWMALRLFVMLVGAGIFSIKRPDATEPWLIAWGIEFLILTIQGRY